MPTTRASRALTTRAPARVSRGGFGTTAAFLVGVCAATSCGGDPPEALSEVTDSAGVHIVTNRAPRVPDLALLDSLETRVGGAVEATPGSEGHALGRVAGAARLSDGRLAVLDGQAATVRVFDRGGVWLGSMGRPGEGPGELSSPYSLQVLAGDTLLVVSAGVSRVQRFGPDGAPAGSYLASISGRPLAYPVALDGGRVAGQVNADDRGVAEQEAEYGSVRSFPGRVVLTDRQGGPDETVMDGPIMQFVVAESWAVGAPFGYRLVLDGEGPWLAAARTGRFEIARLHLPDGSRTLIRYPSMEGPVPASELDSLRSRAHRVADEAGRAPELLDVYDAANSPPLRPAFARLLVDADGRVWANRFEAASARSPTWWVFDPDGSLLTRLVLPQGTRLLDVTPTHAVLERLDDLDVASVEVWTLDFGAG